MLREGVSRGRRCGLGGVRELEEGKVEEEMEGEEVYEEG